MCGIAGFSGNFDQALLQEMGKRIAHRGPDDHGELLQSEKTFNVGLVHQRLSIIDLSADGHQPMTVNCNCCSQEKNPFWLIYNGELYNYHELRTELKNKGHQFNSNSDSEVLLHLYSEEGTSMLKRLNGIFAFAIYEQRKMNHHQVLESGDLFIARDGMGVKPLYYANTASGFLFASELKSLLACHQVSTRLDYRAIHYYLAYLWCPGDQTGLQIVKKCLPGEAIIIRSGKILRQWSYYDIPYNGIVSNDSYQTMQEELIEKISTAVSKQLISDVPIGAFLSGGLDSSSIVAMMKKARPGEKIRCYCIGAPDGMDSEGHVNDIPFAKTVAKHLDVDLQVIETNSGIFEHLKKILYHLDEPQADPAALQVYLVAEAAKQDGIKVLMSGAGGDDIFSGYRRHYSLQIDQALQWLPLTLRKQLSRFAHYNLNGKNSLPLMKNPYFRRLTKVLGNIDLSKDKRLVSYFQWGTDELRRALYTPDFTQYTVDTDTAYPLLNTLARIPKEKNLLNRMLYLETKHFLVDHNLNYTDKMSMAQGIEVRVPLLDRDLVNFAASLPTHLKQKGRVGKALFKKVMENYLPHSIIYRPKTGFGAPLRRWLHNDLQPQMQETLSETALQKHGLFDAKAVNQLIKWDRMGKVDATYTIFSILCIEMWATIFVDNRAAGL